MQAGCGKGKSVDWTDDLIDTLVLLAAVWAEIGHQLRLFGNSV